MTPGSGSSSSGHVIWDLPLINFADLHILLELPLVKFAGVFNEAKHGNTGSDQRWVIFRIGTFFQSVSMCSVQNCVGMIKDGSQGTRTRTNTH